MGIKALNSNRPYNNIFGETGTTAPYVRPPEAFNATGGTKTTPGDGYIYHLFTSSGSFTVHGVGTGTPIQYVVVGGGGGGGWDRGGGGGGGAYVPGTIPTPNVQSAGIGVYPVSLGAGGTGSTASQTRGTNGGTTTLTYPTGPFIAKGGGGGGGGPGHNSGPTGNASGGPSADPFGGSGGGTEGSSWGTSNRGGGSGSYGNPGFKWGINPQTPYTGGGGGGAGAGGPDDTSQMNGGNGTVNPWGLPTWGDGNTFSLSLIHI